MRAYLRSPTISNDLVAFIAEDDVWLGSVDGGRASRVTAGEGVATSPRLAPDGTRVAYALMDSVGLEVYVVAAEGGEPQRLTWLGARSAPKAWDPEGRIVFESDTGQPFRQTYALHAVDVDGGPVNPLRLGAARDIAWGGDGTVVIGRNTTDLARWKRYRGGSAGRLWINARGQGSWEPLHHDLPNVASPMILGSRVWFLADHEGVGNLYSCRADTDGADLRRHTDHDTYYARAATTDGERIVYQSAGDIWLYDPTLEEGRPLEFDVPISGRRSRTTKAGAGASFAPAGPVVTYDLDRTGDRVAVQVRAAVAAMKVFGGPVTVVGDAADRKRLPRFLPDGRLLVVADDGVELDGVAVALPGRPAEVAVSPSGTHAAVVTHEHDLVLVDLTQATARVIDHSEHGAIADPTFAPDGSWLAFTAATAGAYIRQLRLHEVASGTTRPLGRAEFGDSQPSFDPTGRYLWFLSARGFAPSMDVMGFELHFPRPVRPFVVTLRAEDPDPFHPATKAADFDGVRIDLEGIEDRVRSVPVPAGRYSQLAAVRDGAVLRSDPIEGELSFTLIPTQVPATSEVVLVTIGESASHTLVEGVTDFAASGDRSQLVVRQGRALKGIAPQAGAEPRSVELDRAFVHVDRRIEWRQVFDEAWTLMEKFFWTEDMGGVDWKAMRSRWEPMLDRIASRTDLSDVLWELYGELGVSHAYEFGGDLGLPEGDAIGALGADVRWDGDGWRVERILDGDSWDPERSSALRGPGLDVRAGDHIVAIDDRILEEKTPPGAALLGRGGRDVKVTIGRGEQHARDVEVRVLADERPVRYRDWVTGNRERVHAATDGRCGYVHIPNMGKPGFAEFHRAFYAEFGRDALIVDVRFNEGGSVSTLLLEKLLRRRLGWTEYRWRRAEPYPRQAPSGPIVGLCNEHTGSDGDLFSHAFRSAGVGPLVGARTWGGVIGIHLKEPHSDGTITAQPELAHWFPDVGWDLEGTGAQPTHEVLERPEDEIDQQLAFAVGLIKDELKNTQPWGVPR